MFCVYWTTPSVAWNYCGMISEYWSTKDVEGSGRGIFEALCPEGFQQNRSPVLDLNLADSHVNMLTLSTTTFWPQKCYCWTLSWKGMIIKLLFGLPGDKDFCSIGDYAICADFSLWQSRVFDAWRYDSDNTVDEIVVTFWLHCARNSRSVLNSGTSPRFHWQ